jgi:O-antigen/teichoic acid export membrane protein
MVLASRVGEKFKLEFIGRLAAVASGGILMIALARLLTRNGYGLLFLAISILSILSTFTRFGFAKSTSRYLAEFKEKDPSQIPHVIRFGLLLTSVAIFIVSIFLALGHRTIAHTVGDEGLAPFLLTGTLFIAFETLVKFARLILQGVEDISSSALVLISNRGLRTVLAIGLVLVGFGALGALMGYIIAAMVTAMLSLTYIFNEYYQAYGAGDIEKGLKKRIAEYSLPLVASNAARTIDDRIDILLVGFFLNPIAVAYYTISKQIVSFLQAPISALTFATSPAIRTEVERHNQEKAAAMYEEALSIAFFLYLPAAAGIITLASPILRVTVGEKYLDATPVLQVLAIYAVLLAIAFLSGNALDFLGRARDRSIIKGATATTNAVLNVILIPRMGVIGAAYATIITFSIFALSTVYIAVSELDLQYRALAIDTMKILIVTVVMTVVVYLLSGFISGAITLAAVIIVGILVWATLGFVAGVVEPDDVVDMVQ